MNTRRPVRALDLTRRLTAGTMLASTLVVGGLGVHLASSYLDKTTNATISASSGTGGTTHDDEGSGSDDSGGQTSGGQTSNGFGSVLGLSGTTAPSQSGTHGS